MNYIQGNDRNQTFLFPGTIDEIISEDNSVRVIDVFIDNLRLDDLGFSMIPEKGTCLILSITDRPLLSPARATHTPVGFPYGWLSF
ncbi:MAG: hypothetical protein IMY71_15815 [Bacteroidetes bacterium]|nr:hypothetical protein [Bacteroidota bacterium]